MLIRDVYDLVDRRDRLLARCDETDTLTAAEVRATLQGEP